MLTTITVTGGLGNISKIILDHLKPISFGVLWIYLNIKPIF